MHTITEADRRLTRIRPLLKPSLRLSHTQDPLSESQAHAELLGGFASAVPITLHQAAAVAHRLFKADSAGIHLHTHDTATSLPHADMISGALSAHEAAQPSIGRGLCKMSLNAAAAIVLSEQEIELTYLRNVRPRVRQILMAPIYDGTGRPLGTVWLAQVTSKETFSRVDALMLERFTHVLAVGLKVVHQTKELESLRARIASKAEKRSKATSKPAVEVDPAQPERPLVRDELAIREAHHRVKNTLQIVGSLLSLQAHASTEPETRSALQEASGRLQLLTHAHECLYKAASGHQGISVASLLRVLADTLPRSFAETTAGVRLQLEAAEISMPPVEASALALIANELLTNAYKHAFPNNRAGTISIDLERDTSCTTLRVADTGVGGCLQHDKDSFGLTLVRRLAEQLGAALDISSQNNAPGTVVTVRVPHRAASYSSSEHEQATVREVSLMAPSASALEIRL